MAIIKSKGAWIACINKVANWSESIIVWGLETGCANLIILEAVLVESLLILRLLADFRVHIYYIRATVSHLTLAAHFAHWPSIAVAFA